MDTDIAFFVGPDFSFFLQQTAAWAKPTAVKPRKGNKFRFHAIGRLPNKITLFGQLRCFAHPDSFRIQSSSHPGWSPSQADRTKERPTCLTDTRERRPRFPGKPGIPGNDALGRVCSLREATANLISRISTSYHRQHRIPSQPSWPRSPTENRRATAYSSPSFPFASWGSEWLVSGKDFGSLTRDSGPLDW